MHPATSEFETCDGPYAGDGRSGTPPTRPARGTYDLYTGTQESVNTFFAQLERSTGHVRAATSWPSDMGIDAARTAQQVPSLILGVSDVSPLEMAEAYATFAARGMHCDSRPVT